MVTYADRPWVNTYDEGVSPDIDVPEIPLHQMLIDTAARVPHNPALLTTAKVPLFGRLTSHITYAELDAQSDALAAGLIDLGLKKGDRIAIVMPNSVAFAITFFATLKAGGVVAATNPGYPEGKMEYQIDNSGAEIVICLSLFYDKVKKLQANTKAKTVIVANIKEYLPAIAKTLFTLAKEKKDGHRVEGGLKRGDYWFQDILSKYAGQKPNVEVSADDLALIQYTGGTTGVSKGAITSHRALVSNMMMMRAILNVHNVPSEDEIFLGAIPMFHVYGLVAVLSLAVYSGAKIVLVADARQIEEVIECIDHFQPSLFPAVPALYNAINHNPRVMNGEINMKSLRVCISGSAPLPPATKDEFERLSGAKVREGFGMSEAPTATHVNPILGENRTGSIGLPLPLVDSRIVSLDDGITEVPQGEIGELIVSAPNLMTGYFGMPTETQNVLREKDGKVWMYTGDIAKMDEDGYFYIVDRKKDMALIGGYNVYPASVEKAIKEHPAVLEVGVAAIPHPEKEGQEALKAWVVLKPNENVTKEELIEHCSKYLAPYEIPRRIAFIDELPKSDIGKTLRRELVRLEMEEREKTT